METHQESRLHQSPTVSVLQEEGCLDADNFHQSENGVEHDNDTETPTTVKSKEPECDKENLLAVDADKSNCTNRAQPSTILNKKSCATMVKFEPNLEREKRTLNCVVCTQNFNELINLESHVRSHEEVVHFSLVLKDLFVNTFVPEDKKLGREDDITSGGSNNKKKPAPTERRKQLDLVNGAEICENISVSNLQRTKVDTDSLSNHPEVRLPTKDIPDKCKIRSQKGDRKKQIPKLDYVLAKRKSRGRPSHVMKCPECDEEIKSASAMRIHCRKVHRRRGCNPSCTCEICGSEFASVKQLNEHLQTAHSLKVSSHNKIYKCSFCNEFFGRKSTLLQHKRDTHPGQTNYVCDDCGKKCNTPSELTVHRRSHTGEKPFECDQCSIMFRFPGSLKEHMRLHTGEQPFQCDICGAKFSRQCNKRRHMISHTGNFSHSCEYCGKGFNDVGPLKIHIRMHTGEKPFQCEVCQKRFVTKAQMQCHQAKHTQIRSHLCQICGAAFLYAVDLRRHTKIHSGVRNYQCTECNAAFFRLDHLKRHQRSHAANSKRLANLEWKPRTVRKREDITLEMETEPHEVSVVTSMVTQDGADVNPGTSVQHVCVVCSAILNNYEEMQNHMMLHVKQDNMPFLIRDIVQGSRDLVQENLVQTNSTVSTAPTISISTENQPQTVSHESIFCEMCNCMVTEPGGLKEHLDLFHP